ncbi:MAG: hypothetical protein KDD99_19435 [Bacteroidetes bacterium]|nr:hypothetical protein [Bacteroidota bacterium]
MKKFDWGLQLITLFIYVMVSPFVFGYFYPNPIYGDLGMVFIIVLLITIMASILSMIVFHLMNRSFPPEKTYLIKGFIPLIASSLLLFVSGKPHQELLITFLLGNLGILILLYAFNAWVFYTNYRSKA